MRDDPEASARVVDNRDGSPRRGSDGPATAQEIQSGVGVETALHVEGQMEIQQGHWRHGAQLRTLFFEGQFPGRIGCEAGGAANLMLVVPGDLSLEQGVGIFVVGNFLVGQEAGQALLKRVEAAFNFALGGSIGRDPMGRAQCREGSLELGMSVESVGWATMAEERKPVGVEAGRRAVGFQGRTQVGEVVPSGIAAHERGGDNFAGVVVQRENEHGVVVGRPPRMRRTVVLPQFADGADLPAAARFRAAFGRAHLLREVLTDVGGDGGAGTMKVVATGQFVRQESEIERLTMGKKLLEKIVSCFGPRAFVVAARAGQLEARGVLQPLMSQLVEPGRAQHEPLGGRESVEFALIEGAKDFLDEEGGDTVGQLLFFIAARIVRWGLCPQAPEVLSL